MNPFPGIHLMASIRRKLNRRRLRAYHRLLGHIRSLKFERMNEADLKGLSRMLIARAREGQPLDDLLIEAFALTCEAASRVLGMRPFDVQVMAGLALHQGNLVEMQTGEGKTLVAVLPAYLNALQGKGVHVLTFNDYLARRDAEWMGSVYRFLGLTAGYITEGMSVGEKQRAYAADITYVTAKEAGFDYLRDCLCYETGSLAHRPVNFAVVDEADSILIDEARLPLVIAGKTALSEHTAEQMCKIIRALKCGIDYDTDAYRRNVFLTEAGVTKVECMTGCGNLYKVENLSVLTALHHALHAEVLLKRDVDYIVRQDKVELVEELSGRIGINKKWPSGLQAAVEAKEGLNCESTGRIFGSITLQHFLGRYPRICGMTATAETSADEFRTTYGLNVVTIPPNRRCIRVDHPDRVFTHKEPKYRALVGEIVRVHATGQPILIGTASVKESEFLAAELTRVGIRCNVLNARNNEAEAAVIAQAGRLGAVTVSTNMAGRGVDIRLGGNRPEEWEQVARLGGLYVIGTNRHESVRIDNQLRGRAGRQGDPGSSCFFISLEDDLLRRFGLNKAIPLRYRELRQDKPLENAILNSRIAHIQRVVDGQNCDLRRTLTRYSYIVEHQRRIIQERRWKVLIGEERSLLAEREPELHCNLRNTLGEDTVREYEKRIKLAQIDRCWADHLDYVDYVKEGIHLVSIGGEDPLTAFHRLIVDAFRNLPRRIEEGIIDSFSAAPATPDEIAVEESIIGGPSGTWAYIVHDNYFLNKIE